MKLALLSPNLHTNALIGPYLFAKVLSEDHEVEIWGPCPSGRPVWEALRPMDVPCRALPYPYRRPGFFHAALERIRADVLFAFNATLPSFGLGLWLGRRRGLPLLFYTGDWESAYFRELPPRRMLLPSSLANCAEALVMERLVRRADAVASSSSFLQGMFGGTRIPQGCDTAWADPERYPRRECRKSLGLDPEAKYVLFMGQFLPHKGVEDLVLALRGLSDPSWRLLLVGGSSNSDFLARFQRLIRADPRILRRDWCHYSQSPRYLAAADLVVVPQRDTAFGRAQVPVKLYQAMAMGKPIISTAVSDIPEVLEGCGLTLPPGDAAPLGAAIERLLRDEGLRLRWGREARARCVERYSFLRLRRLLNAAIETALRVRSRRPSRSR